MELSIEKGLQIEKSQNTQIVQSDANFSTAYEKGLKQNNVDLYNDRDNIVILNDGDKFFIGQKNDKNLRPFIQIENINLLKRFIYYVTDKHYRNIFTNASNNFNVDVTSTPVVEEKNGIKSEQEVMKIIVKEDLDNLKDDITFQQVVDHAKALTTGGFITMEDGKKDYYPNGQYEEVLSLIKKSTGKKDDIIYNQNLKIFTQIINEHKENTDRIKDQARDIKNNRFTASYSKILQRWKNELDYTHAQYSQITQYIADDELMSNPYEGMIYNTDQAIYSSKDIKTFQQKIGKQDAEMAAIDEGMFNSALLKLDMEDRYGFKEYLDKVLKGTIADPSKEPFTPKNEAGFRTLCGEYPWVEGYIKFEKTPNNGNGNRNNVYTGQSVNNGGAGQNTEQLDPTYAGLQDAAEQNGLRGVLHHTFDYFPNMKAEQKAFRGNALTLGGIGAGLFFGIKRLLKKREKDKNGDKIGMGFLGKLALIAGIGLGSNMLTGKSPLELLDKAINGGFKFKDMKMDFIKFGKNASPDAQEAVVNPFNVNSLLGSKRLSDLPLIMDTKTFKFNNYNDLLKASSGDQKKILENIGSEDKNNVLLNGLKQMGITPDNISELDQNKTVDDYYRQYLENIAIANGYRAKNKLQVVTGKEDEEKKLITSGKPILESDLNRLRDAGVYEAVPGTVDSAEAIADKAALDMQVDELTGIMVDKETLKKEVHIFYDKMPKDLTGKKKVSITQSAGKTYLETYDDKTEINIDKRTIMRYSDKTAQEFVFASINELLAASNLTNYIKKICKEKTAVSVDPFSISTPGGDIEFNDAKVFSFAFDTEIIRAGWGGTLKDISPTLENHKQEYCNYLNTTTPKFWKEAPVT